MRESLIAVAVGVSVSWQAMYNLKRTESSLPAYIVLIETFFKSSWFFILSVTEIICGTSEPDFHFGMRLGEGAGHFRLCALI